MKLEKCVKESFTVIGLEGSTLDGDGFIKKLWADANARFPEVAALAKKDEGGHPAGIWGAMTDFSRGFMPWEDGFSKGLYLAGVECENSAEAPAGWTKWVIPSFEYLYTECDGDNTFPSVIKYLSGNGIPLAGAVQDFTNPADGKSYMFFPIKRI